MKKYIFVFSAVLLLMPFLALAQTTLPSAGITPDSSFYFLDRLGEALQEFFTFNPEAKAHLQITFAAERVAEIKIILETKGISAKGLEVAQSRLQAHLASAATIVTDQKAEGKDVSQLAKELDDEFEAPKTVLEQTFKDEERALETKEKELKAKIRTARQAGDIAQVEALVKELGDIKAQKELLDAKKDDQEKALENENEKIKEEMDAKTEAEKVIRDNQSGKQEILDEAAKDNITVPAETFGKFDELLAQAKSAFAAGNYEEVKRLVKQAEKSLDAAEKAIENLKEAKDNEEEIKADEEERAQETRQTQEEEIKKVFFTQEECEGKTKKSCVFQTCDYIPTGKTFEEVCGKDFKKGWVSAPERPIDDGAYRRKIEDLKKCGLRPGAPGDWICKDGGWQLISERPAPTPLPAPTTKTWTVEHSDSQFIPRELKIKKGDMVMWINRSGILTWPASAIHPTHQVYPGFDALRGLGKEESYSFKFDRVGSWRYHDHLNPSVTGAVIVE